MKDKGEKQVAIVTGGTGALGKTIVQKLSSSGIKVYIPVRNMDNFNEVFDNSSEAEEFTLRRIFAFDCNAENENDVNEFVEKVAVQENGRIDFLVNTVGGIDSPKFIHELSGSDLEKMLKLNLYSSFYFIKSVLQYMTVREFGRIVSIGAIAGIEQSEKRFAYGMAKAGLIKLTENVNYEYKDKNIRANVIVPSIIDTAENREWGSEEDIKKWIKPEDIAEVINALFTSGFASVRSSVIKMFGSY